MLDRYKLLRGARALLYFGPLLAGVNRAGLVDILPFALLFLAWLMLLQPRHWPRRASDWLTAQALVQLGTQILLQLVLAAFLFGIGRGIAGVMGLTPGWPAFLPLFMSFLALILGRLLWTADHQARMEDFAATALAQLAPGAEPAGDTAIAARQAMAMLTPLLAMGPDVPDRAIRSQLAQISPQLPPRHLSDALLSLSATQQEPGVIHRALILYATDPARIEADGRDLPARALQALPGDETLISAFTEAAFRTLEAAPALWEAFPSSTLIQQKAAQLHRAESLASRDRLIQLNDRAAR